MTRADRFLLAIVVGVALAAVVTAARPEGSLRRGDFPAFFGAAEIVWRGEGYALYLPEVQQRYENIAWPELEGRFFYFAYPPYVAVLLSPLAMLGPGGAKLVFTFAMLLSLFAAAHCLSEVYPPVQRRLVFLLLLLFPPLLGAIAAGQNTPLSVLCVAAALHQLSRGSCRGEWLAGLCVGALFFKPHYALILVVLLVSAGAWRSVLSALGVAALYASLAVGVLGLGTFAAWAEALRYFSPADLAANGHQMVSVAGISHALWGENSPLVFFLSAVVSALLVLCAAARVHRGRGAAMVARAPLVVSTLVLAAGHVLYYDLGLLAPVAVRLLAAGRARWLARLLVLFAATLAVLIFKERGAAVALIALPAYGYFGAPRREGDSSGERRGDVQDLTGLK